MRALGVGADMEVFAAHEVPEVKLDVSEGREIVRLGGELFDKELKILPRR